MKATRGSSQVYACHFCVLSTVLRPCRLHHSAAKWLPMASNSVKDSRFGAFDSFTPLAPNAPQMSPDVSQMPPRCFPEPLFGFSRWSDLLLEWVSIDCSCESHGQGSLPMSARYLFNQTFFRHYLPMVLGAGLCGNT